METGTGLQKIAAAHAAERERQIERETEKQFAAFMQANKHVEIFPTEDTDANLKIIRSAIRFAIENVPDRNLDWRNPHSRYPAHIKALVLYFENEKDREEMAQVCKVALGKGVEARPI